MPQLWASQRRAPEATVSLQDAHAAPGCVGAARVSRGTRRADGAT
eukprot:UN13719